MLVQISGYTPVGIHTKNSAVSGVVSITGAAINGLIPDGVLFQAIAQNVRITLDGGNPTSTDGFQIKAGDPAVYIPLPNGVTLKVIEEASAATIIYQPIKFL